VIVLDDIECPYCGQLHEFKSEWVHCSECGDLFRVRRVAGRYEIYTMGDMTIAEINAADQPKSI
jgi:sarcosine oxidase delta subunit